MAIRAVGRSFQITNLTGGNSVNAIASDGLIELELTAGSADAYEALVTAVPKAAADGAAAENAFRGVKTSDLTSGAPATVRSKVTRFYSRSSARDNAGLPTRGL